MIATYNSGSREPLGKVWGNPGEGPAQRSPLHALAGTVAFEDQQAVNLMTIQILDRVVQALFWILVKLTGKRVVNTRRPAFLFEGSQDDFLIGRWKPVTLDQLTSPAQLAATAVPLRYYHAIRAHSVSVTTISGHRLITRAEILINLTGCA